MKYDSIKTPQYTCSMYTNLMILQFEVVESMVKSFLYIFFVWSNRKKIFKHIYYLLMCHYFILRPLYCILGGLGQKKSRRRGYYYGTLWKVLGWGRVLSPPPFRHGQDMFWSIPHWTCTNGHTTNEGEINLEPKKGLLEK